MTQKEQDQIEAYTRECADILRLRDWTLHFDWDTPSPVHTAAQISTIDARRHAVIRFAEDFAEFPEEKIPHYVCHELIHCHFAAFNDLIQEDTQQHFSKPAWDVFSRAAERNLEYTVDAIADYSVALLPKFQWAT